MIGLEPPSELPVKCQDEITIMMEGEEAACITGAVPSRLELRRELTLMRH